MKRLAAALAVAVALIAPAAASAHTVSTDKPVVFISGAEAGDVDCKEHFAKMRGELSRYIVEIDGKPASFRTGDFAYVGDNPEATNCDHAIAPTSGLMWSQSADLINWLWDTYKGKPVDIVAEGSAGVVVRYALQLAGNSPNPTFKDKPIKVEDAITLGTPHTGSHDLAAACPDSEWCRELEPGSDFLKQLAADPQSVGGTDWTEIGSTRDELVPAASSQGMDADHKALYEKPLLKHAELIDDDASASDATIAYSHRGNSPARTLKGRHVADRVADDLVFGTQSVTTDACAGYNDQPNGPVIVDADLAAWSGTPVHSYIRSGTLEAYSACFKKVGTDRYESSTTVRLNGLDIVPEDDSLIFIDVKKRRITSAEMSMYVPTDWFDKVPILLREKSGLDWSLPKAVGAALSNDDLDGISIPEKAKIAGFPINQALKLSMQQGGVSIELELKLPEVFNRFAAEGKKLGAGIAVSVRTDNVNALSLDKLGGSIDGDLQLGAIVLKSASFSYSIVDNEWTASASAQVPLPRNPKLGASLTMKDWQVKAVSGEVDDLQQPLGGSGLFLQRVKLGLVLQPAWKVEVGTTLSVFPRVQGKSLAEWEGTLEISSTSTKLSGKLKFIDDEVGSGSLEVKYAGSATLSGTLKFLKEYPSESGDAKLKFDANATISGTVDGTGVDLSGRGNLCFEASIKISDDDSFGTGNRCLGQATVRASVKHRLIAFTACGQLDIGYVVSGGVGAAWRAPANGPSGWTASAFKGCDVDSWHTPPADSAQAGRAPGVTLAPNLRGAVIGVRGDGAPPRVALTGPDGAKLAAPAVADGIVHGDGYAFVHVPADSTTYVFVAHPAGGRWTVQAQPGSAPVTGVRSADILPQPEVHAHVSGRGRSRTLTYDVKPIPGQVVTFREVGGGIAHTLGTARRSHGTLRFRPAFGPRAVRRIVADVAQRDLPRAEPEVARYLSPKPAVPRAPRRIALRRRGERLAIGWSPVAGASGYAVEVRTGDGRALGYQVEPGAPRHVTVRRLFNWRPSRVTVRALRPDGVAGRAKSARG